MNKELLQQALDALIESRDDVDLCYARVKAARLSFRQERQLGFYEEQLIKHDAAIEALKQALAQQEQRINVPVAHKLAKEQAKTDQTVPPEYLAWLESLYPERNGVGGNEAWNAGIAWFKAQQEQPAQKPDLWKTQFLTDVMTSAGLLMYGRTDKKLAQRIADGSARWRTELYASAPTQPAQEPFKWYDGAPPFPQNQESFIALTIYGERVVLSVLPEEYTYDYTTADGTYMKAENIKKWMQFPDCEFLPPEPAPTQPALSDDEFIAAMDSNGIGPVDPDVAFAIKELVEAHCRGGK